MDLWKPKRALIGALLTLFIVGCSSQPTLHLYGKYLSENDIGALQTQLQQKGFDVEVNRLDTPVSITQNTLLYSLMLQEQQALEQAVFVAENVGFKVSQLQPLVQGNHWYTKNSLALILFPEQTGHSEHFFQQDLVSHYQGTACSAALELQLNSDFSYIIKGKNWSQEELPLVTGSWHFRQFPYVELRPATNTQWHMYFEIERSIEVDQISEIRMQTLTPLEPYQLISGCSFEIGQRITG